MSFLTALSLTAISSTIGLFFCGIPICRRIYSIGSTEGTSGAPFLIASLSCLLWLQYGLLRHDKVVIFVNVVGAVLQLAYLSFYYVYTTGRLQKRRLKQILLLEWMSLMLMEYLVHFADLTDNGEFILGAVCVFLNVSNIAAPLAGLGEVIRTRSSESLPLPLCTANLIVSLQWFAYGSAVEDSVIQIPNVISTFISLLQLSLFCIYPSKVTTKDTLLPTVKAPTAHI